MGHIQHRGVDVLMSGKSLGQTNVGMTPHISNRRMAREMGHRLGQLSGPSWVQRLQLL